MIAIANRQRRLRIPRASLGRLVAAILQGERRRFEVSFAFVNGVEMRKINRQFLDHDFDTDVLSFPLASHAGEVVISTDFAASEASKRRIPVVEEVLRYAAHGLLHLLGYDDHAPSEKRKMWTAQERYLRDTLT